MAQVAIEIAQLKAAGQDDGESRSGDNAQLPQFRKVTPQNASRTRQAPFRPE